MIGTVSKTVTSRTYVVRLAVLCLVLSAFDVLGQRAAKVTPVFPVPSNAPIRLGDAALKLSRNDLTAIESVLPKGKKPWIVFSDSSGPVAYLPPAGPPIAAYLPPETVTPTLIRGPQVFLRQIAPHQWVAAGSAEYAQVAADGMTLKAINWSVPFNRPFDLSGHFEDEEIISIVNFIRNGRRSFGPVSVPITSGRPIRRMERLPEGNVSVNMSDVDWSGERFILKREGDNWVVVRSFSWVA